MARTHRDPCPECGATAERQGPIYVRVHATDCPELRRLAGRSTRAAITDDARHTERYGKPL